MGSLEELHKELEAQIALNQELESQLQQSAVFGSDLLQKNEDLATTLQELREKEVSSSIVTDGGLLSPRPSNGRRRSNTYAAGDAVGQVGSEHEAGSSRLAGESGFGEATEALAPAQRRPRKKAGKTLMVQELMEQNETLEEDYRQLQEKHQKLMEEAEKAEKMEGKE